MSLATPPASLSPRQRLLVIVTLLVVGATRIWAQSKTLWDWDEALFSYAVRDYDVGRHKPHPPGFPVYIGAARMVNLAVQDEFRACQLVVLLAAVALFPAAFLLARELRLGFGAAYAGALFTSFAPTAWLYGGTAFSDLLAVTLVLAASGLLLRGCRSTSAYLLGTAVLALSLGVRPQNLLIALAPGVVATLFAGRRRVTEPLVALLIGCAIVATSYGAAAYATGFARYREVVKEHQGYIVRVDSYHNRFRAPLGELANRHFVLPLRSGSTDYLVDALVITAFFLLFRRRSIGLPLTLATFFPYQIFAWLMLDPLGHGRLSLGYLPMYTLLAAAGLFAVLDRRRSVAPAAAAIVVTALLANRGARAIEVLRTTDSPPVAAARVVANESRPGSTVYVDSSLMPQFQYLLPRWNSVAVERESELPFDRDGLYVTDALPLSGSGVSFSRRRKELWPIVRHAYFDVSVQRLAQLPRFTHGWYDVESDGKTRWRWMQRIGSVHFAPPGALKARLSVTFELPRELVTGREVMVALALNGREFDRFTVSEQKVQRTYSLDVPPNEESVVHFSSSDVIRPAQRGVPNDPREVALKLLAIEWSPVDGRGSLR